MLGTSPVFKEICDVSQTTTITDRDTVFAFKDRISRKYALHQSLSYP